jgi:arsenate reductase-like glutaredoxin family protein
MDIIQANSKRGKKCYYINLEFAIETMWRSRWLYLNKKNKRNLTDIDPLTDEEKIEWLAKENLLIKRPVVEWDDKILVGFDQAHYNQTFNIVFVKL